jgi:hypothetical protein
MVARIVNSTSKYAPPAFTEPPKTGYLHLAASVAPPTGPPFVRPDAGRAALLDRLKDMAAELERLDSVGRVTVYRAVLVPPAGRGTRRPARYDVAVLVETSSPDVLDDVRTAAPYERMVAAVTAAARDVHVMAARCLRFVGDVDKSRPGLFLFNYFAADDVTVATQVWEHLAGWYVAETGLDNSTLLAPIGDADYVFVNHARWDRSLLRLAVDQFAKRSFRRYVLANLRANHIVAMPVLYRLA